MLPKYNHKKIEENWKDKWFQNNIYEAVDFSEKPKKYILAELPYPSGKFLHVGHMMRYTVPEIYSRYLRMQGFNVMYPMGWDSFGLPAETFATKEGITPQEATEQASKDYKKAMQDMGFAIDWNREIMTSDPDYYKWTQWMFIKIWEAGLAELREMPVWWCKELGVLADEEVLTDKEGSRVSERGKHIVEKKMYKQWVLKITDYADKLLEDLKKVDYIDSVKQGQINWIGRKEGALINFTVGEDRIETFTTRPDTIFGVTFLAIAPEHPLLDKISRNIINKDQVQAYVNKARDLSDLEKQTKKKTGVRLEGISAKHPFDEYQKQIPIFVADYIVMSYGTGVIMGVPGHDERDLDFAKKYDLEITKVIRPIKHFEGKTYTGEGKIINSEKYNGLDSQEFKQIVIDRLKEEKKGKKSKSYKLRDQVFSRQRYWGEPIPLVKRIDGIYEADNNLPLELPKMKNFLAGKDGVSPLAKNKEWVNTKDSEGHSAKRETDTMPTWAGSNWYYIRYIDPKNDSEFADFEKMKYWMPVDKYFGDAGHTTAHLMYARFWYKFLYEQDLVPTSEPFNWRMSGGLLLGADGHKMSKSRGNVVDPKDVLESYGADAARIYLAFLGPYEDTYPWNDNGIKACYRLVKNIYEMKSNVVDKTSSKSVFINKKFHKMLKNITEMIEKLKMNTSVSEIMIFVNALKKEDSIPLDLWKEFIKVIAPFAPFVAEELWQEANGNKKWDKESSVHLQNWPKFSEELSKDETIEIPIQINGKLRASISIASDQFEEIVRIKVLENEKIKTLLEGKKLKKFIYVNNRIVNLVVDAEENNQND